MEEIAEIEYVDSTFRVHEFYHVSSNETVKYEVLTMKGSCFVWIGSASNDTFSDLSFAIYNLDNDQQLMSKLLGLSSTDETSTMLAQKLSKRLKKQVYVSFNLIRETCKLDEIEKGLLEEFLLYPEKF